jgi:hypothetical protein
LDFDVSFDVNVQPNSVQPNDLRFWIAKFLSPKTRMIALSGGRSRLFLTGAIALDFGKVAWKRRLAIAHNEAKKSIAMTLQEIEQQVYQLTITERLSLLNTITRSLQRDIIQPKNSAQVDKLALVEQLRGCLKRPGEPAPTDEEIEAMREQRLVEKYLR